MPATNMFVGPMFLTPKASLHRQPHIHTFCFAAWYLLARSAAPCSSSSLASSLLVYTCLSACSSCDTLSHNPCCFVWRCCCEVAAPLCTMGALLTCECSGYQSRGNEHAVKVIV